MCEYCVITISDSLSLSSTEAALIKNIPHEENINNRFPFDDQVRNGCEVFFKGSRQACDEYKNRLDDSIQCYFAVDEIGANSHKLI